MEHYYQPLLATETVGGEGLLEGEEAFHCMKVLRRKPGDQIVLVNGEGLRATAVLTGGNHRGAKYTLEGIEALAPLRPYRLHLAIAPTKSADRLEWLVEKGVELGVDSFHFLLCQHAERKVLKLDRLVKKAVSAMKQSGNLFLPAMYGLVGFAEFMEQAQWVKITRCMAAIDSTMHLFERAKGKGDTVVLVGPEGDFSEEEKAMAQAKGWLPAGLGPTILRTETAGLAAIQAVHMAQL